MIQIVLSFLLTPEKDNNLSSFNLKNTWKKLKNNEQIRKMSIVEFFIGMNVSDGALEVLMTILIFNSFKTNFNLGIITSITTLLSILCVHLYGKFYKYKDKFSEEQKQILSYLGFIPETEVVDINHITQYVLTRLNQATEKGNAEMINNYQNILGIINQKNNGLNGAENNPHHL